MAEQYNNLDDLRKRKQLLKNDVKKLENLLSFENPKESLSVFTKGFTDDYIKEPADKEGSQSLSLNTANIIKDISTSIKDKVTQNSLFSLANSEAGISLIENTLKIGAVTFMGNYAQKNLKHSNWKKKAIGIALVYVAPIVLKYVRKELERYQKNKATSSLEKLI